MTVVLGSIPDLLRLLALPVFGWAAYRDVKTRRVPNRTWLPLAVLGTVLLLWDGYTVLTSPFGSHRLFLLRVAISLGFVAPLAYGFWYVGGFGGADAKAFMLVALLFPVYPTYLLSTPAVALPLQQTTVGVFSLTILSNTVLAGLAYPLALAGRNLLRGRLSPAMFIGRPVPAVDVTTEYGRLLADTDGFTRAGLDLDALRMYLQWRGTTLAAVQADPAHHRNPASLPEDPNPPGDGGITGADAADGEEDAAPAASDGGPAFGAAGTADPWGAERFLADIDHSAYGTSADQLRGGLEVLASRETVWVSPGIPFLVPMFAGLVLSLTYGDVLFALLQAAGLA